MTGWGAAACTAVSVSGSGAASFISAEMEIPDASLDCTGRGRAVCGCVETGVAAACVRSGAG